LAKSARVGDGGVAGLGVFVVLRRSTHPARWAPLRGGDFLA
jgi:hypothetical protein